MYPPDEISVADLKKDLLSYNRSFFRHDVAAGLAVMLLSIPQALAYSIVVGLPAYCGLISTIFGTGLAAFFGSSRHLVIGPNNTTVLLVQSATASILAKYYPDIHEPHRDAIALQIMAALLLLMGLFQLLAGVLKMGRVIQFVSFPVVIGYILGSACALIVGQVYTLLGIPISMEEVTLFDKIHYLFLHFEELYPPTAFIGVMSFTVFFSLRRLHLKAPASLIMLIFMTALVYFFGTDELRTPNAAGKCLCLIGDEGRITTIIPNFQLPLFELRLLNILVPIAFAIALISMLETTSIAKSIAASSGQRLSVNQEFFGLGIANIVLSLFGALPASGSLSRTITNYENGAATRFAAVFSAIFVVLGILFFGRWIQYVPLTALAALIVATAMRAVDFKVVRLCLSATHSDALVFVLTFFSCFFFSLHIAFYIGVMTSIVLYLRKAASPRVVEYTFDEDTLEIRPMLPKETQLKHNIRVINVEGELFFGAADLFQTTLKAIAEGDVDTRVFVLRLKHVHDFDASAATALKQLYDFLQKHHRHLVIATIPTSVWEVLENARLIDYFGKENLFPIEHQTASTNTYAAILRAKALASFTAERGTL